MPGYRNPIIPGFNPDPTIICVGKDYFLATSTFEYFPGVPIYHSTDLINWNRIGHVLTRPSQLDIRTAESSGGIYAPTLRYHKGRYYMTTCCCYRKSKSHPTDRRVEPRGFYVWTDNIWDQNSWSDPIHFDVLGIDQDLFFDDDDKVWLSYSVAKWEPRFNMYSNTCQIDLTTGRRLSPVYTIARTDRGNHVAEGPHIFKKDGWYYLITANGGTEIDHQEWVYRSKSGPAGPWETGPEPSVNPIVHNGKDKAIRQTGHMDIVQGPGVDGRWWAVFLAVRPVWEGDEMVLSQLGRESFLCPVEWKDGWPIVNDRQPVSIEGLATAGLARLEKGVLEKYDFKPDLDLSLAGWYHIRTPFHAKREYDLSSRPGSLALLGGPYDIQTDEATTMLLQKQIGFEGEWKCTIEYDPDESGHEAGVSVWWSRWAMASLGVRGVPQASADGGKEEGGKGMNREMVFRYPSLENDEFKESIIPLGNATGPIQVRIEAKTLGYTFFATDLDEADERQVGYLPAKLLARTRPFDSIMTGTHLALYAQGHDGIGSRTWAYFSNVSWEGVRAGGD